MSWQGWESAGRGWGKEMALKALTHHQMRSGVWEILIRSRTAPQSLAGAVAGDAEQHLGKKEVFQQSHWHGPGSDRRVSAQPHMMFEVSWFSTAFTASDTTLSHQDLSPGSTPTLPDCLNLGARRSPCLKLQDTSSATVKFPAPNSLWAASHRARQTTPSEGSDPTR